MTWMMTLQCHPVYVTPLYSNSKHKLKVHHFGRIFTWIETSQSGWNFLRKLTSTGSHHSDTSLSHRTCRQLTSNHGDWLLEPGEHLDWSCGGLKYVPEWGDSLWLNERWSCRVEKWRSMSADWKNFITSWWICNAAFCAYTESCL